MIKFDLLGIMSLVQLIWSNKFSTFSYSAFELWVFRIIMADFAN